MVKVEQVETDNPDALALIAELDAHLWEQYSEDREAYAAGNILPADTTLVVAYLEGEAVGCGAFKPQDAQRVEIKRMYTRAAARGSGVATAIVARLEQMAREAGYAVAVLETGIRQQAAIRLYTYLGYAPCGCWGIYIDKPLSRCYEKRIM